LRTTETGNKNLGKRNEIQKDTGTKKHTRISALKKKRKSVKL
jgi:hypothetical protein